jgi:Asp/Glu/hydantoin racemase
MTHPSEKIGNRPHVLLVNANSSTSVTNHMMAIAQSIVPRIGFTAITPRLAPVYVLTPVDVLNAAHAVMKAVEDHIEQEQREPDACLVACFGEVAMSALRHRYSFPIVNMAEAGILTALQLGVRYAILALGDYWPAMLDETVRLYGLHARYSGAIRIEGEPLKLLSDQQTATASIVKRLLAVPRESVDVIVFGGAALTGLPRLVQPNVPFKLVDCLHASLAQLSAALLYRDAAAVPVAGLFPNVDARGNGATVNRTLP